MEQNQASQNGISGLLAMVRPHKGTMILSCLFSLLGQACGLMPFILIYFMVTEIAGKSLAEVSVSLVWSLVVAGAVSVIFRYVCGGISSYLSHSAAYDILYDLRIEISKKLASLPLGYFNENTSGRIKKVMLEDVEQMEVFIGHNLPEFIGSFVNFALSVIVLFVFDWRLALATVALLPLSVVPQTLAVAKDKPLREKFYSANEKTNSAMVQYVHGMPVIKAFGHANNSFTQYSASIRECAVYESQMCDNWKLPMTLFTMTINANLLLLLPVGSAMFLSQSISISTLILFLLIGLGLGTSLQKFMTLGSFMEKHLEGRARINQILNAAPLPEPANSAPMAGELIDLKDVTFSYKDKKAIDCLSLRIPAKHFIALVGPSGAGKTTLARLIPRFWDVDSGSITLGGADIRNVTVEDLMDKITFVFQDVFLFNDTILNNLRIGKPDATNNEIEAAARAACCHDFIMNLPGGYGHVVGEKGAMLSGGEKQRISIARALLKNAPVLVMDEATAFIDPENEVQIQNAINALVQNKTLVVIAHRLSTIIAADMIVVMDKGRIVASGTHEDLLRESGLYKNMWSSHVSSQNWSL